MMGFFIFQYRINKMMKEINVFTFIIFDLLTHGTESKLTAQDWGGGGEIETKGKCRPFLQEELGDS